MKPISDLLPGQSIQLALALAALAVAVALGGYVIGKIRAAYSRPAASASELLTDFREMHSQGELSDEEFRTIKSMLSEQLAHEVKRTAGDG
jgi:hypothetical protein